MPEARDTVADRLARRHLRFGWTAILVFAVVGLTLEVLHGLKVRAYLDVSNETRRLLWTLAHAHGTLLGMVNVLYGLTVASAPEWGRSALPSRGLIAAAVLLPTGFFLGGLLPYAGDPGLGVLLVPIGAAALIAAVVALVRSPGSGTTATPGSRPARK